MEQHPDRSSAIAKALADRPNIRVAISPLVRLEALVDPVRRGDVGLVQRYEEFLAVTTMLIMDDRFFDLALRFRAMRRLKTPDALHLATAVTHACAEFWTNDDRLVGATDSIRITGL